MRQEEIRRHYRIRRLGKAERIGSFDCGDADLNDFILNESAFYREALLAVSYVFERRFLICLLLQMINVVIVLLPRVS